MVQLAVPRSDLASRRLVVMFVFMRFTIAAGQSGVELIKAVVLLIVTFLDWERDTFACPFQQKQK